MKFLFERLKELKQMETLKVVDPKDADCVTPRQTAHDAHLRPYDELNKKIEVGLSDKFMIRLRYHVECGNQMFESVTNQFFKLQEQEAEQTTATGSNSTLEWQLADIRKAVSRMQVDFCCTK